MWSFGRVGYLWTDIWTTTVGTGNLGLDGRGIYLLSFTDRSLPTGHELSAFSRSRFRILVLPWGEVTSTMPRASPGCRD